MIPPDADLVFDVELLDINGKHSVLTLHKCTSHAFLNLGFTVSLTKERSLLSLPFRPQDAGEVACGQAA